MLGAVKGDPGTEDVPLFRLLARRWKSLAPVQRERSMLLSTPKDEPKQTRAWISKGARAIYANRTVEPAISKRAWNPWLWVK
ncbi:MAG: hypothetical protein WCE79_01405 [Xanthobacteraceae bacterium]